MPLYAGFAFSLYFGAFKNSDLNEWLASVVGSLGGIFVASLFSVLPLKFGTSGLGVALIVVAASVYALVMGWVPVVVNYAFMLMLVIATIPSVQAEARFPGMACAVMLAGLMLAALQLVGRLLPFGKVKSTEQANLIPKLAERDS